MLETKANLRSRFEFKMSPTKILIIGGAVLLVIVAAIAGYFSWQYFTLKNDPTHADKETVTRVMTEIEKIYDLPTDETPQIAQLKDVTEIKKQTFYAKALAGDYVLIYKKAQLAVLYRESVKKLINVDTVTIGGTDSAASSTPAPTKP